MKLKLASLSLAVVLLTVIAFAPFSAEAAQPGTHSFTKTVTGTVEGGGTFAGTYTFSKFAVVNNQIVSVGTLSGTLTDALGGTIGTVTDVPVNLPLNYTTGAASTAGVSADALVAPAATCPVLHLTLGPLDLNLLGLMVHLNQVVLNIDAQSGPGNLLGNLLCAVAGLLNGGGPLTGITNLLNQILSILNGL